MPKTELKFFQEDDGSVPVFDWLNDLPERARDKGLKALEELAKHGHELRRPLQERKDSKRYTYEQENQ